MALTPVTGQQALLKVNVSNTNATLAAINWTLEIDPKAKDVSNFRDGRFRAKTLQDATLTTTVVHDAAAAEYLAANGGLIDGATGTAYCFASNSTNTNAAYIVPFMITKHSPKNDGPEGIVMVEIQAMLHNGTVTYPTV
jgi:hypothetical protein